MTAVEIVFSVFILWYTLASCVQFTAITSQQQIYSSIQAINNIDAFENGQCCFVSFKDTTNNNKSYHWFNQAMFNYTDINIYTDYLKPYNINNNLTSQLPHVLLGDYAARLDSCASPINNNILTCVTIPSCCYGCSYITCHMFYNNGSQIFTNPYTPILISGQGSHFAQAPQVSCMEDGFLVSWLDAVRDNENSNYDQFKIQYGTIDLNGNIILANQTLIDKMNVTQFADNMEFVMNNFNMISNNNKFIMTHIVENLNGNDIMYSVSDYNGIHKGLTLSSSNVLYHIASKFNNNIRDITTRKLLYVPITEKDNCCTLTAFTVPSESNKYGPTWMLAVNYLNGSKCHNDTFVIGNESDNVYFMDMIVLNMLNDNENVYVELIMDVNTTDSYHQIIGKTIVMQYIDGVCNVNLINGDKQLVSSTNQKDGFISFCMNILPESNNMIMSWAVNPNEVTQVLNGFMQTWNVSNE